VYTMAQKALFCLLVGEKPLFSAENKQGLTPDPQISAQTRQGRAAGWQKRSGSPPTEPSAHLNTEYLYLPT
jgi:hypothetical protein